MTEQLLHRIVTGLLPQALEFTAPGTAQIAEIELTEPNEESVLVRTLFSGISKGTESLVFHGKVPVSEHERMRCPHMRGDFSFPISYGYCCVGEVLEVGKNVKNLSKGQKLFVLHPHQNLFWVDQSMCNPVPEHIPANRAVMTANMETAVNAVWDGHINTTDETRLAVIGAGVVGLLTATALRSLENITPILIDIDESKRKIANSMGFELHTPVTAAAMAGDEGFDYLFHTSASGSGLQTAIDLAAVEGKIIEMSWYGDRDISLRLGGAFHSRRLQLVSSQVSMVAPAKRDTHDYSDRLQIAMQLLKDDRLDQLLETEIEFEALPVHLSEILAPGSSSLCQVIKYP